MVILKRNTAISNRCENIKSYQYQIGAIKKRGETKNFDNSLRRQKRSTPDEELEGKAEKFCFQPKKLHFV